jgi:hypothetical protein
MGVFSQPVGSSLRQSALPRRRSQKCGLFYWAHIRRRGGHRFESTPERTT